VLFGWSYDYVGDLAETTALIWPARRSTRITSAPQSASRRTAVGPARAMVRSSTRMWASGPI